MAQPKAANNRLLATVLTHAALLTIALLCLVPFIWMLLTALKPGNEVMSYPPTWLPSRFAWENFPTAFKYFPVQRFLVNTLFVAVVATVIQIATSALGAYAFARLRFPGRDNLFLLYIGTLMIPQQVTIVPLFLMMRQLEWLDSYQALILPAAFHAFGVFMMRQFLLSIPKELEEAAYIDGAGRFRIFWQIMLPLSKPALATLAVFTFNREWTAFLWPLIATNTPEMRTISVGLTLFMGQYGTDWHLLMSVAAVTLVPTLVLFVFAQRYFVQGITLTGMGGR